MIQPVHIGTDLTEKDLQQQCSNEAQAALLQDIKTKSLREITTEFQKKVIQQSVQKNNNNWAAIARELGLHRSNLHNLAKRLGILNK